MQTLFSYTACKIIRLGRRYIHVVLCTYTYSNANTMRTIFSPASRVRCAANAYIVQKSGSSSPASFSVRHTIACPFASSRMALRCAHNLMLYIRAYTIHCFQTHKEYTHTQHTTQNPPSNVSSADNRCDDHVARRRCRSKRNLRACAVVVVVARTEFNAKICVLGRERARVFRLTRRG